MVVDIQAQQQTVTTSADSGQQQQGAAQQLPAREQQPGQQPAAPGPASGAGSFSLYNWLTWGSSSSASASTSSADSDAVELADGMAAEPPLAAAAAQQQQQQAGSSGGRWRSWYGLSRSSASSMDDADAPRLPEQQIPVRVDHPALQLLRQRALSGSQPGARRDPFKLGLVVEGGGMRGCVSGGALQVGSRAWLGGWVAGWLRTLVT